MTSSTLPPQSIAGSTRRTATKATGIMWFILLKEPTTTSNSRATLDVRMCRVSRTSLPYVEKQVQLMLVIGLGIIAPSISAMFRGIILMIIAAHVRYYSRVELSFGTNRVT